jgi:hypothetical protein
MYDKYLKYKKKYLELKKIMDDQSKNKVSGMLNKTNIKIKFSPSFPRDILKNRAFDNLFLEYIESIELPENLYEDVKILKFMGHLFSKKQNLYIHENCTICQKQDHCLISNENVDDFSMTINI